MFDQGYNWISQPPPNLRTLPLGKDYNNNKGMQIYNYVYHNQLLWHTATMFKCGEHLITNTTGPGSQAGLEWMSRNLPPDTVVENSDTTMRNWGHIDHGFFMIDDDTVICVDREFVPTCLRDKKFYEVYQFLPKESIDPSMPVDWLMESSKGYEQIGRAHV